MLAWLWWVFGGVVLVIGIWGGVQTVHLHRAQAEVTALTEQLGGIKQAVADAADLARKQQAAEDAIAKAEAVRFAESQQKIKTVTHTITKEIQVHVKDTVACVTYGLVRVLDAAAIRTSVDALSLPSGATDDTCAPITPSALAESVANNYGEASLAIAEVKTWRAWYGQEQGARSAPTTP